MKKHEVVITNKGRIQFRNQALSKHSRRAYRGPVKQYRDHLLVHHLKECEDSLLKFVEHEKERLRPSSFNLHVQALKEYLLKKYEGDDRQLFAITRAFSKIKRAKLERHIQEYEYLTYDQIVDLCMKLTPRMSLIVQGLFLTGLRVEELLSIRLDDIVVNRKVVIHIRSAKGGKEFTVYLPLNVYNEIVTVFQGTKYLFETTGHKKFNQSNVRKELKRQGRKYGYEIHPHLFRHSKGMYLKDVKKLSADQVAKALNHANVKTTLEHYFHGSPTAEVMGILDWKLITKTNK